MKYSKDQLEQRLQQGEIFKYLFFWGDKDPEIGRVSKACFSQWYESSFTAQNNIFATAEHWMMFQKALLFDDQRKANEILDTPKPGKAKALGREILNFDQYTWDQHKYAIVLEGNLLKFKQNAELASFLLSTGQRVLAEASPVDTIWGIGLEAKDPNAQNPSFWKGENLLGFALMEVRDLLIKQL